MLCIIQMTKPLLSFQGPADPGMKTRMRPYLSKLQRLRLHHHMFAANQQAIKRLSLAYDHYVFLTGVSNKTNEPAANKTYKVRFQRGDNLGDRMKNACASALKERYYKHIIIIGSDCPSLSHTHFIEANKALLSGSDAHIVKAKDGGYVLLAINEKLVSSSLSSIFEGINWGSDQVFAQTSARLKQSRIPFTVAGPLHDVDNVDDLATIDPSWYLSRNSNLYGL